MHLGWKRSRARTRSGFRGGGWGAEPGARSFIVACHSVYRIPIRLFSFVTYVDFVSRIFVDLEGQVGRELL